MKKQVLVMLAALLAFAGLLTAFAFAAPDAPAQTNAAELSGASDAYAILYEDGTLVFQNGAAPDLGRAVKETYEVDLKSYNAPWESERESIRVASFANKVIPISTAFWFWQCSNLERVDNIQNLDTANVTDMSGMFSGCSALTALDVSRFDTANVTNMGGMFYGCSGLTALDVSRFDTANVTNMSSMFQACRGLTALDVSRFDTANVTNMSCMFAGCSGLTALDLSCFDTVGVTDMHGMFGVCRGLTTLDLFRFDTASVTNMSGMFDRCSNLKTICVSGKFTTASVTESEDVFSDCTSLVGGAGTTFDASHTDKEYARIDAPSAPGYFAAKDAAPAPVAYRITNAVKENGNLSVTLSNPGAATLAASYFDADGKCASVRLQDVPANAGTVALALAADAKTARVMLLDGALCPLCAAYGVALAL